MRYLLDTNICVFLLRGEPVTMRRMAEVRLVDCALSVITIAELKFGSEVGGHSPRRRELQEEFVAQFQILPLVATLDVFVREKARLRRLGTPLEDFDLPIGATAIAYGLTCVTNNTKHFSQLDEIQLEDWRDAPPSRTVP